MRKVEYCENYQNVMQGHKVSECCWKNGTDRLAQCRVATNSIWKKHNICEAQ